MQAADSLCTTVCKDQANPPSAPQLRRGTGKIQQRQVNQSLHFSRRVLNYAVSSQRCTLEYLANPNNTTHCPTPSPLPPSSIAAQRLPSLPASPPLPPHFPPRPTPSPTPRAGPTIGQTAALQLRPIRPPAKPPAQSRRSPRRLLAALLAFICGLWERGWNVEV